MKLLVDTKQVYIAMAEKGFNGADLAREAGVTPTAVSNVLNGKRRGTTKVLGNICKALDLSVRDVLQVEE
ncbi:helix-turn-helix domain-containing protein [Lacrimispora sp.]|uniref:helix-turn-helix domain-containing protein n=1 Tax=Lacrimispora sp. TaxID=2719234 RepID=UPI0028AE447C|nr:helix-turn-helix transcriptional regulator [Lacrimispora sp.]